MSNSDWFTDKSRRPKGIKANSKEYMDGWDRIFGKKKENSKEDKKDKK